MNHGLTFIFPGWQEQLDWALAFAESAHEGQTRKYSGVPYITHPIAVAQAVYATHPDIDWVCAALLHDVIEDCGVAYAELHLAGFTDEVVEMVGALTNEKLNLPGLTRSEYKMLDRERLEYASSGAQSVKCADIAHNAKSILVEDPKFAKTFIPECRALLDVLHDAHPELREAAYAICNTAFYL